MKKNAKVAIVGATGFAGRNVWNLLTEKGYDVHGLSRISGCDLLDLPSAWRAIDAVRPDFIVNCAAHVGSVNYVADFAAAVFDDNMRMLLNLYKIAMQLREVVVINPIANCAYPGEMDVYEESKFWSGPIHPSVLSYGATRRMIDVLARCYRSQYGVRSANVHVPNMYGPYDSTNPNKTHALNALVIKFVKAAKNNDAEVEVWGTGKPIREWLYVKDFARIIDHVIEDPEGFLSPVNIAQNQGLTVDELVSIIKAELRFKGKVVKNLKFPDGAPKKVMDDRLFKQRFPGFKFTEFRSGLKETIAYYQKIL